VTSIEGHCGLISPETMEIGVGLYTIQIRYWDNGVYYKWS